MDYLIVVFLSLMTPFSLSLSNIEYTPGFSIKISDSTTDSILSSKLSATPIETGTNSDFVIHSVDHYGPYGVFYDVGVEFQVYPFSYKNNRLQDLWVAPKFGFEPLRDAAMIEMQSVVSTRPTVVPVLFNPHPSFGINIGYDLYTIKRSGEIIAPYIGLQFMRIGYEGEANFDQQELFDSSILYTLGLSYRVDRNWALNVELSRVNIDMRGVEGQNQDLVLHVDRVKFGATYYLSQKVSAKREDKDRTYTDVLRSIDPTIKRKMRLKKKADKEAEIVKKAEEHAKKAAQRKEKAEQDKIEKEQKIADKKAEKEAKKIEKEAKKREEQRLKEQAQRNRNPR